ncbi:hypothetical protein V6N12_045972 [Hibiscus sabdariffa]|uniref:Uncharacterized protein n=1 Tax=Hibiscus sabdariffa TaxID=183260 RepID=A0ABR2G4X7_9ROSI
MVRHEMVLQEHVGERSLDVGTGIVQQDIEVSHESNNAYHMLDIVVVDPLTNVEPKLALITTPTMEFVQYNGRKNEEVLLDVDRGKKASLGLNWLKMEPYVVEGVEVATLITLKGSYIESLVLLDVHGGSLVRTGKYIHMLFH